MPNTEALQFIENLLLRTDRQTRDILATQGSAAEVDTINVIVGDGVDEMAPGISVAIRVDFRARITGAFLHEFDGIAGTVQLDIQKSPGALLTYASIVASDPPRITSAGRYGANETLTGWDLYIDRGDILRYHVVSAASFTRLLVALRIRRLEP